ncbi:tRNA (N6-threonylcarbamoyladenosine(37)-N6)-methyltransferase TrmO [bacterium]|nr:tRNA (N6-threonylcarbamoyladenosine(37)-N6)-methyltransferase TrmO [bacterium]
MGAVSFTPIGTIRTPHKRAQDTPVQPAYAEGVAGRVELLPEYAKGLRDLSAFSHIYLIYHLHKAGPPSLKVIPFMQDRHRGVFATRSPRRPNPIGMSLVKLIRIEGNILHVEDVDILDGTPLLDIKPYIFRFDSRENARSGWQDDVDEETARKQGARGYRGRPGEDENGADATKRRT